MKTSHDSARLPEKRGDAPNSGVEGKILFWGGLLFASNVVCVLMLAARASSPPYLHAYYDAAIFVCLASTVLYAVFRIVFKNQLRLLDLFTIVTVLSFGMKATIDLVRGLSLDWIWADASNHSREVGPAAIVLSCLIAANMMLAGLSLGLRNCRILKKEGAFARALTLSCGMLVLPGFMGFIGLFLILLEATRDRHKAESIGIAVSALWIASGVITALNAFYSLKALALNAQISSQEGKWREK